MNRELLEKWLSDNLNDDEKKVFNSSENAEFFKKIIEDAKAFAPGHSSMPDAASFMKQLKEQAATEGHRSTLLDKLSKIKSQLEGTKGALPDLDWSGA